ncbi:MAG: glucose 1-dehydrogenase [Gammaproteobacteria bacterium]|nr:glucose 1-dehydrogenase [Gammaproteobacteria bacterium]NIR84499.1 glucose 1-dehydrogenase [Gammaproteobacteria bacterium]NIR90402.1 glucose 1-dehydrogenase [Gammaproteobacteria bacterium]NIU05550.1 glucose 1-dehydrogenase [Gammaproteobacteria bacterium]NIV52689.1 glucose 1-dehydrogenase [Gammaproteobacteria bacterium]
MAVNERLQKLFDLSGRVALVTGASRGIGRRCARTLAEAGAAVAVASRDLERGRDAAREIERAGTAAALALALDVTAPSSVRAAIERTEGELGGIDILVNNAGVVVTKPLLEQSEADWERVVDTNLRGAWLMAQQTARRMADRGAGGSIINIASVLALRVTKQVPGYAAAKAGLVHLTRAMALELADHDIRVNAIAPGYIETDMNREFLTTQAGQRMVKRIPQRRIGQPSDLDGVIVLLASGASAYMTGSIISVDGGHSIGSL